MNFVVGEVTTEDRECRFRSDGLRIELPDEISSRPAGQDVTGGQMTLGIRPEDIAIGSGEARWEVDLVENLGADRIIVVHAGTDTLRIRAGNDLAVREGQKVALDVPADAVHLFDASRAVRKFGV
jgi:ABC-type sugar transport system ATPase subunit